MTRLAPTPTTERLIPRRHGDRALPADPPRRAEPLALAVAVATAYVEVRSGRRSHLQLRDLIDHDAYWRLCMSLRLRPWHGRAAGGVSASRVVHDQPDDGVVEAAVILRDGDRVMAVAVRLERRGTRWAVIDIGLPDDRQ